MSRRPFLLDGQPVPAGVDVVAQVDSGKPLAFVDHKWREVVWREVETNSSSPSTMVVESPVPGVKLIRASELEIAPVEWFLKNRIAMRALSLLAGEGGKGKSTIVADYVAQATTGRLPGRFNGTSVNVLWVGNEDGYEDVIVPRLKVAGADLNRVYFLAVDSESLGDEINVVSDIDKISSSVKKKEAKLVVIDPLVEYLPSGPKGTDSHNDASVRQALRPARNMAATLDIGILALVHFNKASSLDVATRIAASAGFRNAARSVLVVADHPEEEGWRCIFQNKSNWGPEERKGTAYKIEGEAVRKDDGTVYRDSSGAIFTTARVVWGDEFAIDPNSLPDTKGEREAPKRESAEDMLRDLLGDHPWLQRELEVQAKLEGLTWITVRRAADELGIEKRQIPVPGKQGRGPSWWALPSTNWADYEWLLIPPVSIDEQPFIESKGAGQSTNQRPENERLLISTRESNDVTNHSGDGGQRDGGDTPFGDVPARSFPFSKPRRGCDVCGSVTFFVSMDGRALCPRHKKKEAS